MRRLFGVILLLASTGVCAAALPNWYGPYVVTTIEPNDSGVYFLKPTDISGFPYFGCGGTLFVYFANATKLADRALAVGLTAQTTGKKVKFYLTGCNGGYINASAIQIDPAF